MKIVSYCLWGENAKYNIGAIRNAELAQKYLPDWKCWFYCANSVPKNIIQQLSSMSNVLVKPVGEPGGWKFTVNRFLAFSEDVERVISRDTDSRFSEREVAAINQWVDSGKDAHIMRDHPYHGGFPMLAGMIGIKGGVIKNVKALLSLYQNKEQYHYDQIFLANFIYPLVEDSILVHDEFFEKKPFPLQRDGLNFVGQVFDENDQPVIEHQLVLRRELNKYGE